MLVKTALLGLAAVAAALPAADPGHQILTEDDVILFGHGGMHTVMKRAAWEDIKKRELPPPPPFAHLNNTEYPQIKHAKFQGFPGAPANFTAPAAWRKGKRADCEESSEVKVNEKTNFQQWDVAMSSVVQAEVDQALVTVTDGYSLANSLTVGVGTEASLIKDVLSVSLKIDYGITWTTTQTSSYSFYVPKGKSGVIVSNPDTLRYTGEVLTGCTDNPTSTSFQTDVYTSKTYKDLSWVQGLIHLCSSDTYPVPFCVGTGEHR